jgi:hypothetical protein
VHAEALAVIVAVTADFDSLAHGILKHVAVSLTICLQVQT